MGNSLKKELTQVAGKFNNEYYVDNDNKFHMIIKSDISEDVLKKYDKHHPIESENSNGEKVLVYDVDRNFIIFYIIGLVLLIIILYMFINKLFL